MLRARARPRRAWHDHKDRKPAHRQFSDESAQVGDADAGKVAEVAAENTTPSASMLTHLDNIAIHKRAPVQQAIAVRRC